MATRTHVAAECEPDTPGYRYRVLYWADAARAAGARVVHLRIDELDAHRHEVATVNPSTR